MALNPWGCGAQKWQDGLPPVSRDSTPKACGPCGGGCESLKSLILEHFMPKVAQTELPQAPPAPEAPMPAQYELALSELEQLVGQLESGQMPLDQLLSAYQRGASLLAFCRDKLKAVENQIQVLDGEQLKPWGDA